MKSWEKYIRKVVPYVPGEQPDTENMIKLNTNENPYPPAPGVEKVIKEFNCDSFKLYPDPAAKELVKELAEYYNVKENQVFTGVGSDDVLGMAFLTFFNSDKPILFPDVTYSFYDVWAGLYRIPFERPSLDEQFKIKKEDYYKENGGIVIANPNAPTGICEPLSFIEDILKHNEDSIVIIDEAYIDFGGESAISLVDKYDNILVVQTFSKSRSMAGVRIGYAIGNEALIKAISDIKYSYNSYTMNMTAICTGAEAVRDDEYFKNTIKKIVDTRERVKKELEKLDFVCTDSKANFLFVSHKRVKAQDIFCKLREKNIYVRYFNIPRIDNYLRITIGTDREMDRLVEELEKIVME